MNWTRELVHQYLTEAADTLYRLPKVNLSSRMSSWPEVVRSAAEVAMAAPATHTRRAAPAPDAITRMDRVFTWLLPLSGEERRIVWARACGIAWRRLEDIDGRSHVTLRKIHASGVDKIMCHLLGVNTLQDLGKNLVQLS